MRKNECDRMNVRHLLLIPSDFLACRFDEGYAKLVWQIKREICKVN